MNPNILPTDRNPVAGVIDPANTAAGDVSTGWVSLADYQSVMAILAVGTMSTDSTVDAKIEEAKDDSGTDAQDLTGKAITQLTEAGGDSDSQAIINVRHEELSDEFTHVRLTVTVATAASDLAAVALGYDARYEPQDQAASVAEVVE